MSGAKRPQEPDDAPSVEPPTEPAQPDDSAETTGGVRVYNDIDWKPIETGGAIAEGPFVGEVTPLHAAVARLADKYNGGFVPRTEDEAAKRVFDAILTREGPGVARDIAATTTPSEFHPDEGPDLPTTTLDLLDWGPVPDPLVNRTFLTPEGDTIIYAPGGTGKGITACWLVLHLIRTHKMRVAIIDYEYHPSEWARRCRGLGYTDEELAMVEYWAPYGTGWAYEVGPLVAVANDLRRLVAARKVGYLVVDSYSAGTTSGDTMGGEGPAKEYFGALRRIGVPSLTIAHVAGGAQRFPDKPFGSIHIKNLSREMWAMEQIEAPALDRYDAATAAYMPAVIALELRCTKNNNASQREPQFLTFAFHINNQIDAVVPAKKQPKTIELALDVLTRAGKPMSAKDIALVLRSETGEPIKEETVAKALQRSPLATTTDDVPKKWTPTAQP